MSDEQEQERDQVNHPDEHVSKEISIEYRPTGRGDARLILDGADSGERVAIPEHMRPSAPQGDPDEAAAIRAERDELRQRFEEAEPYIRIAGDPIMRDILNERIERGEIESPRSASPDPEHIIGYKQRMAEPESAAILGAMADYAATLPNYQAEELNSNHRAWCAAYDRFKQAGAGSLPRPAMPASYPNVPMDRRSLEAILKSKEVSNARVEGPGGAVPDYPADDGADGRKEYANVKARLQRANESGTPGDRDALEMQLVAAHDRLRSPRRSSTGGGVHGA
jgi:hypothetical protein